MIVQYVRMGERKRERTGKRHIQFKSNITIHATCHTDTHTCLQVNHSQENQASKIVKIIPKNFLSNQGMGFILFAFYIVERKRKLK